MLPTVLLREEVSSVRERSVLWYLFKEKCSNFAKRNTDNLTDTTMSQMHLCDINPCQNLCSSVLKLLIHFFFSSELATPAPTISTTKQRPDVISSTYTENHLSTNDDLNEEREKNKEKRQSDEEGITSQSVRTIIIFCSLPW